MRERILNHLRNVFDLQQRIQPAIVTLVSVENIRLALASFTLFISLTSTWSRSICGDRVHSLYELCPFVVGYCILIAVLCSLPSRHQRICTLHPASFLQYHMRSVSHFFWIYLFSCILAFRSHSTLNVPASPLHLSLVCHPRAVYRYPPPSPPFIFLATSPHSTRLLLFFLLPPHLGRSCFFIKRFECFLLLCSRASHATP